VVRLAFKLNCTTPGKTKQKQNQHGAHTQVTQPHTKNHDYVLGFRIILLIAVLVSGLGNNINTVGSPRSDVRLSTLLPIPRTQPSWSSQANTLLLITNPTHINTSHVWRKIWRKSCCGQELPISIGQGWSRIPSRSCSPSSP